MTIWSSSVKLSVLIWNQKAVIIPSHSSMTCKDVFFTVPNWPLDMCIRFQRQSTDRVHSRIANMCFSKLCPPNFLPPRNFVLIGYTLGTKMFGFVNDFISMRNKHLSKQYILKTLLSINETWHNRKWAHKAGNILPLRCNTQGTYFLLCRAYSARLWYDALWCRHHSRHSNWERKRNDFRLSLFILAVWGVYTEVCSNLSLKIPSLMLWSRVTCLCLVLLIPTSTSLTRRYSWGVHIKNELYNSHKQKKKLHGLSPQGNYTDRATAACRWS
jgi:hypothetical protein